MSEEIGTPSAFFGLVDLAGAQLGARVLAVSDEWFADAENMIQPHPAVYDATRYTETGKWMDGWESRRKRVPGHDWCILRLGGPGRLRGVDLDTAFFLGNHAPFASIDACVAPLDATGEWLRDHADWVEVLPQTPLKRGSPNLAGIYDSRVYTHVRVNMYPDGGIARFRLYGEPVPDPVEGEEVDLASLIRGARTLVCNDSFFSPMHNLLLPHRSTYMREGWETRRSRPPGMDWIVVRLSEPGRLSRIVLETTHFKGNYPDRAQVDSLYWPDAPPAALVDHPDWEPLTPSTKMRPHADHTLEVLSDRPVTHLRLRIIPDGGIARLRAWGLPIPVQPADEDPLLTYLNGLSDEEAVEAFARCCGSARWAQAMKNSRPFTSRTHLFGVAEQRWWHLGDGDWIEAFGHHPRIGASPEALAERFASTAGWAASEQAGVRGADDPTLQALARGNEAYEERFGYLFIICATGLSASQMLEHLTERLENSPENELRIAAGEQARITRLRLEKLEIP